MEDSGGSRLRVFLGELRRRRVVRVAVVYAVATFVILQVADIAFPALRLPEWTITLVVALALLGFPVAVVLAWAFDITPHGVKRTEPLADEMEREAGPGRVFAFSAVVLVLGLTIAAGWIVLPRLPGLGGSLGASRTAGAESREKLVVLPFVNLGGRGHEYFADGITEEITARLAFINELGVIARTTAVQYKESEKTIQEIGAELGVNYILEGTVRWEEVEGSPSRVRVTPQLIRVSDATHVWADIYEEPISSVFQVQSDIAEKVAEALGVRLVEPERLALKTQHTENLEAYNYYLLGNQYLQSSRSQAGAREALEMFERAVELDPQFELASDKLAEAHANFYWANFRMLFGVRGVDYQSTLAGVYPESFGADTQSYYLVRAILLDRMGDSDAALAYFDSARIVLEERVTARPDVSRFHAQLGLAYAGLGRDVDAVREGGAAVGLLPISRDPYAGAALVDNLAHIYVLVGDYDEAIDQVRLLMSAEAPVSTPWLRVDPTWDPIREDPRFQEILEPGS